MFTSLFKDFRALYAARHEPENMRPLAEVYWRALLMIGLIMVALVLAYGIGEFVGVMNNLGATDPARPPSATLDRSQLRDTLSAANKRLGRSLEPRISPIDPSR